MLLKYGKLMYLSMYLYIYIYMGKASGVLRWLVITYYTRTKM